MNYQSKSLVSCIVTTKNRASFFLNRAINSILNQTYQNIELIIINDASNDNTKSFLEKISNEKPRINHFSLDESRGPQFCRNQGIKLANGNYIAFLDDDDEWLPKKIEKQINLADTYSMVSCPANIVSEKGSKKQNIKFSDKLVYNFEDIFNSTRYFYPSGILMKRKHAESCGGFNIELQEWDYFLKVVKNHGPAVVIDEHLVNFDRNENVNRLSNESYHHDLELIIYNKYKKNVRLKNRIYRIMNIHRGRYLKEHSSIRSFYSYLLFKFYKYVNIIFTKLEKI